MLDKISIIYNTCDKYESLWQGFFALWDKYWPNCTNKIILNTETKGYCYNELKIVRPNKENIGCSWSKRLLNSLDSITTKYALLVLDDFYIKSPIKLNILAQCIQHMEEDNRIKLFTFGWQPGPNKDDDLDPLFELRGRWAKYRVNAQIGLWRVDYLRKILKMHENPWQFELNGSFRSSIYGGKIYALKKDKPLVFDYDWGFLIIRGKINNNIKNYFVEKELLSMSLPFESFSDDEYYPPEGAKISRIIKYGIDMVTSLFKR